MATDALLTYMNDHLAGSRTAIELLEQMVDSTSETEAREFLERLHTEIVQDRDVLEKLISRAGGTPSVVRDAGGWIAEKFARLKLAIDDPSYGPLRRLETLEILALGIQGKASLWRALSTVAPAVPALAGVNFADLGQRAAAQYARVEAGRIEAAQAAFMRAVGERK